MEFLLNERSLHAQFNAAADFEQAVNVLMNIRSRIRKAGRELFCHRSLANASVAPDQLICQAIQSLDRNAKQAFISWITKGGPFWIDQRHHPDDQWFEIENGTLVTDSAVAEAAYCLFNMLPRETVSFSPSDFIRNPISVTWRTSDDARSTVAVPNHWEPTTIEQTLAQLPTLFDSWDSLEVQLRNSCDEIKFANEFLQLEGFPFKKCVGEGIFQLVTVLNKLSGAFNDDGTRTGEFDRIYETFFKGRDPYFTDESKPNLDNEQYVRRMTFPHPNLAGQLLLCSWHGKVNSPKNFIPIRIHFSWPVARKGELYLPYIGKKLTM